MTQNTVTWSHSALKDFEGCARRYHEVKVLKQYPFQDTVHTKYGKEVHKAIELYGRGEEIFPDKYHQFKEVVDVLLAKPGRRFFEHEMGVTAALQPCAFGAENRWVRGIADLLIVNDDNLSARVIDWKTGGDKYPDRDQLTLMSLMVFAHFPHVRTVSSALVFLVKGTMVKSRMMRGEAEEAWWRYRERVAKLEACVANDVWNPKQSPLCGWCPVLKCEHNPKH